MNFIILAHCIVFSAGTICFLLNLRDSRRNKE